MRVIYPIVVNDDVLFASNLAEDDHPEWNAGTSYTAGDHVILSADHGVHEAVVDNIGHAPAGEDGTHWIRIGATNRWKPFDGYLTDRAEGLGSITYTLTPSGVVRGIALFGLAGLSVRVRVAATGFDRTVDLVDGTEVSDWFDFFSEPIKYDSEALLADVACYGTAIEITVDAGSGTARVGQIVLGRIVNLGTTLDGTQPDFVSYSVKSRDDFGRANLVRRDFADTVTFRFAAPTEKQRQIKRVVTELDAVPAVWFAGEDMEAFGVQIYGYPSNYDAPLSSGGTTFYTLEIEGAL